MQATHDHFDADETECGQLALDRVNPGREDAFWHEAFRRERYFTPGLDYEDYAPAYCVGYIGFAQYGGSFGDAEKSLCANWERIKGDSRLDWSDALLAMRAAWDRMAERASETAAGASAAYPLHSGRQRLAQPPQHAFAVA
jgi:hypothetical protein